MRPFQSQDPYLDAGLSKLNGRNQNPTQLIRRGVEVRRLAAQLSSTTHTVSLILTIMRTKDVQKLNVHLDQWTNTNRQTALQGACRARTEQVPRARQAQPPAWPRASRLPRRPRFILISREVLFHQAFNFRYNMPKRLCAASCLRIHSVLDMRMK